MLVTLLQRHGGDGIDFDWEHLSEYVRRADIPPIYRGDAAAA